MNLNYSAYLLIPTGSSDFNTKKPAINFSNIYQNVHKGLNLDTLFDFVHIYFVANSTGSAMARFYGQFGGDPTKNVSADVRFEIYF